MKIAVLGNGGFGTAMAMCVHRAGNEVCLWGHDSVYTAAISAQRTNERYLPGVQLPDAIRVTHDAGAALDAADAVFVAVPTQHVRSALEGMREALPNGVPLVSLSKGLEEGSGLRPSEVLGQVAPSSPVVVLSGPSHAEEIAHDMPTLVVVAGDDDAALERLQQAIGHGRFRVYRNDDPVGVELCGALKNVMALAAGIAQGLGFGDNAKAALVARGLVEMARFGTELGARAETFQGLAGVGDLSVTAFSKHSRNRAFGERLGGGQSLDEILASTHKVAEGVWTARVVHQLAAERNVDMPITAAVHAVLFEGQPAAVAVDALMARDPKAERD